MFKFIENAMADANIRRCERELEKSDVTMGDIEDLNMAMKLTDTLGIRKACNLAFGAEGDGDDDEIGTAQLLEEVILQQTNIENKDKYARVIAKMIAKVNATDIPSDQGSVRRFLLKSGFTEDQVKLYYKGVVAISQTPYYASLTAKQDQSLVDGIQEAVNNSTQVTPIQNPVANNPQGQQWGFQPAPELISPAPAQVPVHPTVSPITPVAPSAPIK